jgi:hypothetical protein
MHGLGGSRQSSRLRSLSRGILLTASVLVVTVIAVATSAAASGSSHHRAARVADSHGGSDRGCFGGPPIGSACGTLTESELHQLVSDRALAGFQRVFLRPGQSREVAITLTPRAFQYWSTVTDDWATAWGDRTVSVGSSSPDIRLSQRVDLPKRGGRR